MDVNPDATDAATGGDPESDPAAETIRLWLVERTYSDDEQNIVVLVYATPDGERYYRKERALVSFSDHRDTTAAVDVSPDSVGAVTDPETRERYAAAARRVRDDHDPGDAI
jgi:hypothetical protein